MTTQLENQWLPVALEDEITHKPKRFLLLGVPLVIVRLSNALVALQDRCPHRGAPLSSGLVKENTLQCPYHGWRFNEKGECVEIPGLISISSCHHKFVPAYEITVHLGLVFVCLQKNEQTAPLYPTELKQNADYHVHLMRPTHIAGGTLNVIENLLDATHTNFVHAGLLRHDHKRQSVTAYLKVDKHSAEVRYQENKKPTGIVSTLFEKNRAYTIGRFHFPLIAELEYHSHQHLTASFTVFFSPTTASMQEHRVFTVITSRKTWFPTVLKRLLFLPFIFHALRQDKSMLRKQAMNLTYFPKQRFQSTELDLLRAHIERIIANNSVHFEHSVHLNL